MGHLMVSTMQKIQSALGALTLEHDGIIGKGLYIYGEAWDFGEVCATISLLTLDVGGTRSASYILRSFAHSW